MPFLSNTQDCVLSQNCYLLLSTGKTSVVKKKISHLETSSAAFKRDQKKHHMTSILLASFARKGILATEIKR